MRRAYRIGNELSNELSNNEWFTAALFFCTDGITAKFPNLGRVTNQIIIILNAFPIQDFPHMEDEKSLTSALKRHER